jgi:hypothetical protein
VLLAVAGAGKPTEVAVIEQAVTGILALLGQMVTVSIQMRLMDLARPVGTLTVDPGVR